MNRKKDDRLFKLMRSEFDRGSIAGWNEGFDSQMWQNTTSSQYRSKGPNHIDHFYNADWKGRADPAGYIAFRLGYLVGCAKHADKKIYGTEREFPFRSFFSPAAAAAREALFTALTFLAGSPAAAREVYDDILYGDWLDYGDLIVSAYLTEFAANLKAKHRLMVPHASRVDYRVFIVHGRDIEARDQIADAIYEGGFSPVILDATANRGRTIIEKLEDESAAFYSVGVLTPDDVGGLAGEDAKNPRARQNVIFELGWFMAALGRHRVCCILRGDMELPSDLHGLTYYRFNQHAREVAPQIIEEISWWL